jgi:hypothetical protein
MAKGRVINKSISTSKKVNLGLRSPLDCLLYTWGLTHADDDGRIDGHATIFRATVAPALPGLTDARTETALTAMIGAGLILRYTIKGVMVVQFLDWEKYQSFHGYHRSPSSFPPPAEDIKITHSGELHQLSTVVGADMVRKVNEVKVNKSNINKDKYLDFVHLSQIEYSNLLKDYGKSQTADLIDRLNNYIGSKGTKYKSHYHTLLNWARRDNLKKISPVNKQAEVIPTPPPTPPTPEEIEQGKKFLAEFNRTHLKKIGHPHKIAENAMEAK